MQGVVNAAEFANPRRLKRWMLRASGWRDATAAHEGGVWNPLEVKLRAGEVLYRVGHSHSSRGPVPESINLSSPWWLESGSFAEIGVSAEIVGLDRQRIARLRLSVSERYGVFDTIFCVQLRVALGALRGGGNPVYDPPEPGSLTPPPVWAFPGRTLMQVFIPGLRDFHDRPTGLSDTAFKVLGARPVHAWQSIDEVGLLSL